MNIINKILMVLVGGLFVCSGVIKAIDPVGTQIKLEEYFEVFAQDLKNRPQKVVINGEEQAVDPAQVKDTALSSFFEGLKPFALYFSLVFCAFEIILGMALLLGYRIKATIWAMLLMILFFTFLTFYSFYYDKVTDCGCFGDAVKLTPKQSFFKDIILTILIGYLFVQRKRLSALLSLKASHVIMILTSILAFGIGIYAINFLPPIDFRPYKVGQNIPQLMKPSAPLRYGQEKYTFLNLMTHQEEVFNEWEDKLDDTLNYKYLSYQKPLLNPEDQAKITDFSIWNDQSEVTKEVFKGKLFLIIIQDLEHTHVSALKKLPKLIQALQKAKIKTWIVTASNLDDMEAARHEYQLAVPAFAADKKVLKTIIRSNPGFLWLDNGTIRGKWHYNQIPNVNDL